MRRGRRLLLQPPDNLSGEGVFILFRSMVLLLLVAFIGSPQVMASDSASSNNVGRFSMHQSGGMQYGSITYRFDGIGKFYVAIGDTITREDRAGVGVFELIVLNDDLSRLREIAGILCGKDAQSGGPETFDPAAVFSVTCLEDDLAVEKNGSLRLIPESLQTKIYPFINELEDRAWNDGRKLIKLDYRANKIKYENGAFIVSIDFINSGRRKISFSTPDQWPGTTAEGRLGIGSTVRIEGNGVKENLEDGWGFTLGGQLLINKDEFPGGVVILNPGESRSLVFKSFPDSKASKGEYEFTGVAFMDIRCEGNWWAGTRVDFSPIKTRLTIDRDYPSTPDEREEWEARHRAAMLPWPVKPGETFPEDGLYRAVRVGAASRSLQVRPFKAGEIAPTDNVRLLSESASGHYLDGRMQWLWEASLPVLSSEPFKMVEGTEQVCEPGAVCSRSGRWLVRFTTMDWKYDYDLSQIVTMQQGRPMPAIRGNLKLAKWEWIGV